LASSLSAEILTESGLSTEEAMDAVEVAIARTLTGTDTRPTWIEAALVVAFFYIGVIKKDHILA
jgi:hypothetical protein